MTRHALVGTAGHVDHGKTALVAALTGIDCDRLAEEKQRGITIDLGFAHLFAGDLELGFVDVPGHERFLHNALAGLGGIRILLLVVAADEGVKPQTREHLAIASLLAIPRAVVALTKRDLVASDLAGLAALEVAELLAPTPFAGAPVFPVSSTTGDGIAALREALVAAAAEEAARSLPLGRPTRLPIDRAFHLKGHGAVVTGTLVSGRLASGDALTLLPAGISVRARSLQVHGRPRREAEAGERTAVQVAGADLAQLERGGTLATPEAFAPSRRLCLRFTLLADAPAPLSGFVPVALHLFSQEVPGRLRPLAPPRLAPGESGLVELRLARPVVAARGDRAIVRRLSPAETLGGGELLDPLWRPRRRAAREAALAALGDERSALTFWIGEAGLEGATSAELARRCGRSPAELGETLAAYEREGGLLRASGAEPAAARWLLPRVVEALAAEAKRLLADFFARDRLAAGMPRAEAVKRLLPGRAAELSEVLFSWLVAGRAIALAGDVVTLPGRAGQLAGSDSALARALLERLHAAGLEPPSPAALATDLMAKPQIVDGLLRYLVERGEVVKLPGGLLVARSAFDRLRADLLATGWERFGVGAFKERFGLSRKWAIPLLEQLDSLGVTRRHGDERLLRRPAPGRP